MNSHGGYTPQQGHNMMNGNFHNNYNYNSPNQNGIINSGSGSGSNKSKLLG